MDNIVVPCFFDSQCRYSGSIGLYGSALVSINKVTLRRFRLVLGWMTDCGRVNHHQPLRSTQPSTLSGTENEYRLSNGDLLSHLFCLMSLHYLEKTWTPEIVFSVTVTNWVFVETTHVVGSKSFQEIVLRFECHQKRSSGFGTVWAVERCPFS